MKERVDAEHLLRSFYAREIETEKSAPRSRVKALARAPRRVGNLRAILVAAASITLMALTAMTAPPPSAEATGLAIVQESIAEMMLSSEALAPLRDGFLASVKEGGSI